MKQLQMMKTSSLKHHHQSKTPNDYFTQHRPSTSKHSCEATHCCLESTTRLTKRGGGGHHTPVRKQNLGISTSVASLRGGESQRKVTQQRRNSLVIESGCGEVLKQVKILVKKISKQAATKKQPKSGREQKNATEESPSYFTVRTPRKAVIVREEQNIELEKINQSQQDLIGKLEKLYLRQKQKYKTLKHQYIELQTTKIAKPQYHNNQLPDYELCESLRQKLSKIISYISQEKYLARAKDIGDYLMSAKLISEKLMENFEVGEAPLIYHSTETFKSTQQQQNTMMNTKLQLEMYDNENRNLRNERERLMDHIKQLEVENQNHEKAISFLSTQNQLTQKLSSTVLCHDITPKVPKLQLNDSLMQLSLAERQQHHPRYQPQIIQHSKKIVLNQESYIHPSTDSSHEHSSQVFSFNPHYNQKQKRSQKHRVEQVNNDDSLEMPKPKRKTGQNNDKENIMLDQTQRTPSYNQIENQLFENRKRSMDALNSSQYLANMDYLIAQQQLQFNNSVNYGGGGIKHKNQSLGSSQRSTGASHRQGQEQQRVRQQQQ